MAKWSPAPRSCRVRLQVHGHSLRTGYVEAVATRVDVQGPRHGTRLMRDVNKFIRAAYQLGALSTGSPGFYARLGWEPWLGSTAVRTQRGPLPTPDDDGGIMVLPTPATPPLDRRADQLRMAPRGRLVTRYRYDAAVTCPSRRHKAFVATAL